MPAIALVFHESEQRGDNRGIARSHAIFDRSRQWRGMLKLLIRQEGNHFDFRMDTRFDQSINFQPEAVAEDDRGIRLFYVPNCRSKLRMALAPHLAERPRVGAHQFSNPSAKGPSAGYCGKKRVAES